MINGRAAWLVILSVVGVGCGIAGPRTLPTGQDQGTAVIPDLRVPTNGWKTDFGKHVVPLEQIASGGPGKDGIPAVDQPRFASIDQTNFVTPLEPLLVVTIAGQTHAYPYQIMIWHEIVNDTVGGKAVAVTFCPLCGTGVGFIRTIDGQTTSFGTTGNLRRSDLVMYDRLTETWWQQATGEGIVGAHAGEHLQFVSALTLSWDDLRRTLPGAAVLQRDTGYTRRYGENPYPGYDGVHSRPFLFKGSTDGRLPAMARVLGVRAGNRTRAYPFELLQKKAVVNDIVNGVPVVVFFKPGVRSALDAADLPAGRAVGTAAAWDPRLDGQLLTFAVSGDGRFREAKTGSEWDITGRAVSGTLKGRQLTALESLTSFWFAWAAFEETDLYRG